MEDIYKLKAHKYKMKYLNLKRIIELQNAGMNVRRELKKSFNKGMRSIVTENIPEAVKKNMKISKDILVKSTRKKLGLFTVNERLSELDNLKIKINPKLDTFKSDLIIFVEALSRATNIFDTKINIEYKLITDIQVKLQNIKTDISNKKAEIDKINTDTSKPEPESDIIYSYKNIFTLFNDINSYQHEYDKISGLNTLKYTP